MTISNNEHSIPLEDFKRICSTIYSILKSEGKDLRTSCVFVSVAGALILNKYYQIPAKVFAGGALYKLSDCDSKILALIDNNDDLTITANSAFHCWIDTGEFIFDFASPMFSEMLKLAGHPNGCENKMFQKKYNEMALSPNHLKNSGDYFLIHNNELTAKIMDDFFDIPSNEDLLAIILEWYKKPPLKMLHKIQIGNSNGSINNIFLADVSIKGSW